MRMARRLGAALILLTFVSVFAFATEPMTPIEKEVKDWLNAYAKAYEKKDLNALMSMISTDPKTVLMDSGPQGRRVGPDEIKSAYQAEFGQVQSVIMDYKWLYAGSKGDVAWFATELIAQVDLGKEKFQVPGRWSGVLEKQGGKWVIALSHFSYIEQDEKEEK